MQVRGDAAARIRGHARGTAAAARVALASRLAERLKADVVTSTQVDTGRLRRGWSDAETQTEESDGRSRRSLTNDVPYARYVEYGTRRTAPRHIVRRALRRAAAAAAGLFRLSPGLGDAGGFPDETSEPEATA